MDELRRKKERLGVERDNVTMGRGEWETAAFNSTWLCFLCHEEESGGEEEIWGRRYRVATCRESETSDRH